MKLKTVFAFVAGASVGSAITAVEIGKAIGKNYDAKLTIIKSIREKTDDILFGGRVTEHKFVNTKRNRVRYNVIPSIFESAQEVDMVIDELRKLIEVYDYASVYDYYKIVGIATEAEDVWFGWDNDNSFHVINTQDGYKLTFDPATRF